MTIDYPAKKAPVDLRIALYRFLLHVAIIVGIGVCVKLFLFDTAAVKTHQMHPAVMNGDRILYSRAAFTTPLSWIFRPKRQSPVVFRQPYNTDILGCLRIAGKPGDVVSISNGLLSILNEPLVRHLGKENGDEIMPMDYSPRDWFEPYYLPRPGDTYKIDTLSQRDLIFIREIMRQENPQEKYILQPLLHINDSVMSEYVVSDFSLYKGAISAVPEDLAQSWFFWDRLREYLRGIMPESKIDLKFSISHNGKTIESYTVMQPYYFLIADNWREGNDSRYSGPVCKSLLQGKVLCVLWSFDSSRRFLSRLRFGRICRLVT